MVESPGEADLKVRDFTVPTPELERRVISPFESESEKIYLGECLSGASATSLEALLAGSRDVFAWTAKDL